jgi:hypothetical protein
MRVVYQIEGFIDPRYLDVEDGGQAMIYQLDESMGMEIVADKNFFVKLQSWDEKARSERGRSCIVGHELMRSLVRRTVRVTVEVDDGEEAKDD